MKLDRQYSTSSIARLELLFLNYPKANKPGRMLGQGGACGIGHRICRWEGGGGGVICG